VGLVSPPWPWICPKSAKFVVSWSAKRDIEATQIPLTYSAARRPCRAAIGSGQRHALAAGTPRTKALRAILDKLDPPAPRPEPFPAPKSAAGEPTAVPGEEDQM
jgi:hypothetical protein